MLNKVKIIKDYKLNCQDGEIGKVKEFYFDDQTWKIRYLIVNSGNWLTGRRVLISPQSIISVNTDEESITLDLTKSQIENSPILESDKPVSKQFQQVFYGYYGYPMTATGIGNGGAGHALPNVADEKTDGEKFVNKIEDDNEWDPNLRSTHIVSGYDIQASDDQIGHLDDFIIDTENWEIRYLEIDTNSIHWLPGRKFLISPNWIDRVSWNDSKVFVNLNTDDIKQSPEYNDETILNRDYETRLHKHYNRSAYWLDKEEVEEDTIK